MQSPSAIYKIVSRAGQSYLYSYRFIKIINSSKLPIPMSHDTVSGDNPGNSEIVLYRGAPLEKIASSAIVSPQNYALLQEDRLHLASDVIIGKYGVAGFVLVDNKPKKRWKSYVDPEWQGVGYHPDEPMLMHDEEFANNPFRQSHFLETDKGFMMLRYFVLPSKIKEFFDKDKYLGEPVIRKFCLEGTLPEEFDEEEAHIRNLYYHSSREAASINSIIDSINPNLKKVGDFYSTNLIGHYAFISFHRWPFYMPVVKAGEEAVVRSIRNFDEGLSKFDSKSRLSRLELDSANAQEYIGVLPLEKD